MDDSRPREKPWGFDDLTGEIRSRLLPSLVAKWGVDVVGYVARRVRFPPDAPDVVAEVFTITWRATAITPT